MGRLIELWDRFMGRFDLGADRIGGFFRNLPGVEALSNGMNRLSSALGLNGPTIGEAVAGAQEANAAGFNQERGEVEAQRKRALAGLAPDANDTGTSGGDWGPTPGQERIGRLRHRLEAASGEAQFWEKDEADDRAAMMAHLAQAAREARGKAGEIGGTSESMVRGTFSGRALEGAFSGGQNRLADLAEKNNEDNAAIRQTLETIRRALGGFGLQTG
jgi:hypothetical protein